MFPNLPKPTAALSRFFEVRGVDLPCHVKGSIMLNDPQRMAQDKCKGGASVGTMSATRIASAVRVLNAMECVDAA